VVSLLETATEIIISVAETTICTLDTGSCPQFILNVFFEPDMKYYLTTIVFHHPCILGFQSVFYNAQV